MSKVYIVKQDDEGSYSIQGVFSSWDKARASIPDNQYWEYKKDFHQPYPWYAQSIVEYELQ